MIRLKNLYYFILCVALSSCAITEKTIAESNTLYDKEFYTSLKMDDSWLTNERTTISFDNGNANNCKDYIELAKDSALEESVRHYLIKSEYLECEVLDLIKNSHAKTVNYQNANGLVTDHIKLLAQKLDLTSFKSSLSQLIAEDKKTLAELYPNNIKFDKNNLTVETENRHFSLQLVAKVHINNNQHQDWILIVSDEILDGTYRSFDTIIIKDPDISEQSLLAAKSFRNIQKN